jgi:hypothetical protein
MPEYCRSTNGPLYGHNFGDPVSIMKAGINVGSGHIIGVAQVEIKMTSGPNFAHPDGMNIVDKLVIRMNDRSSGEKIVLVYPDEVAEPGAPSKYGNSKKDQIYQDYVADCFRRGTEPMGMIAYFEG